MQTGAVSSGDHRPGESGAGPRWALALMAALVSIALALSVAGCGEEDDAGSSSGVGTATATSTVGQSTDILDDTKVGRDIARSVRDTGVALRDLASCGRSLSCYRREGSELATFATAERERLAPRVARARTGCIRETGELQLDLLEDLSQAGQRLSRSDYQGVIRTSIGLARRFSDVGRLAGGCADVVLP
jgi:hypothetical protein